MDELDVDSYNRLLKTEQITIEIGDEDLKESIAIHKGFLALRSTYLAGQLAKSGMLENNDGKIQILNVPASAVKVFAKWCYEGHLQYPWEGKKVSVTTLNKRKALLIDVWFFCDMYGVAKLQNQVIRELCLIFGKKPSLLSKDDVCAIVDNSPKDTYNALAQLAIVVLVAVLEDDNSEQKIDEYEAVGKEFDGFMVNMYKALRLYSNFTVPKKEKTTKAKMFLEERVADGLQIVEDEPAEWVLELCGKKATKPAQPTARPFQPGEIIELD